MSAPDVSPEFGFHSSQRKLVQNSCTDLARSISTLEAHHAEEAEPTLAAVEHARTALAESSEPQAQRWSRDVAAVGHLLAQLRGGRGDLLSLLLPLRALCVDAYLDAQELTPDALMGANTAAYGRAAVPVPIGGRALRDNEQLAMLVRILEWTRDETFRAAFGAAKASYALPWCAQGGSDSARRLHSELRAAHDELTRFMSTAWRGPT